MKDTNKSEYRTGPTAPPKSYGSLIAVLLVAVILFGGLASVLGIMNIRLLEGVSLAEEEELPIYFHNAPPVASAPALVPADFDQSAETVTPFLRNYYHLPEGVYIAEVTDATKTAGLIPGDIILKLDDTPVTDKTALLEQLAALTEDQIIRLTVYRQGKTITLDVSLDCEE